MPERKIADLAYHDNTYTYIDRVQQIFGDDLPQLISARPGESILDWGCSSGMTTVELSYILGPTLRYVGLDRNAEILGTLASDTSQFYDDLHSYSGTGHPIPRNQIHFVPGNGYDMGELFRPEQFASVFLLNNLYIALRKDLITDEDVKAILEHISIFVRPQGNICISGTTNTGNHYMVFQKGDDCLQMIRSNLFAGHWHGELANQIQEKLVRLTALRD